MKRPLMKQNEASSTKSSAFSDSERPMEIHGAFFLCQKLTFVMRSRQGIDKLGGVAPECLGA